MPSRVIFGAPTSGTYYLNASDAFTNLGTYKVSATALGLSTLLTDAQIDDIYSAVLQRHASLSELANWPAKDSVQGHAAAISQIVSLPEAQDDVYPVIQVIKLAIGIDPTAPQLAG